MVNIDKRLKSLVRERQRFWQILSYNNQAQMTMWIQEARPTRRKTYLRLLHGAPAYRLIVHYLGILDKRIEALTSSPAGTDQGFDEFRTEMVGYISELNGKAYWEIHKLYDKREVQRLYERGYSAFQTFCRIWPIDTKKEK